jgi:hypothetical protein
MPFAFLQRGNLSDHARQLNLTGYTPELQLHELVKGVDNVRTDVFLSSRFCEITRQHILKLLAKHGGIEDFLQDDAFSRSSAPPPRPGGFIGSPRPASLAPKPPSGEPADFKRALAELQIVGLNRAKQDSNVNIDLAARLAIIKFQRAELGLQYNQLLERGRAKLKGYEGPRSLMAQKGVEIRERFARFQVTKKIVLRKAGQELFSTAREVEKETIAKMRRSLLGDEAATVYDLLLNRLLFTEDGRDDYLNAEQYVMLGNYERDPDRFSTMLEFALEFLKSCQIALPAGEEERGHDALLSVPENAMELFAGGSPDESPKGKSQKALVNGWMEFLENEGVMDHVVASYEVVPLLPQYANLINPQQLKNALISRTERKRVETFLDEHGKISPDALQAAVKKVEGCKGSDRAKMAGRFMSDFIRYHRDLRRFEAVMSAMDEVNVIGNEKLRELSAINNTLYEFLLPEEQKAGDATVVSHVILKADIRDSTMLTRTLYERGLNPASFFSLNFFEPVNKILPKYEATKVFIEGDALILALFENEGEAPLGVARTCVLAREMIQIVQAYNENSSRQGLPNLELGLGICYQDSPPMYLMDGSHRIMISKALNESDRLSGCSKGARKYLGDSNDTLFNVYSFQTIDDADTAGMPDEFLVRYNIGGIHINALGFEKLRKEIALKEHEIELPMLWEKRRVKLYSGMVPVGHGIFHKLVVREGIIPYIDARDFSLKQWTEKKYYEVCVNEAVYEYLDVQFTAAASASGD